jgi:hypothetical protein
MWQRRSPPQPVDEVQSHRKCGSAGAHLDRELRSRAVGHVAAPDSILAGWQGQELQGMW